MRDSIEFPNDKDFLVDLVLQRTGTFVRLGGGEALNSWFKTGDRGAVFNFLRDRDLIAPFLADVEAEMIREARAILAIVPVQCLSRIVSIGPGNGILELIILRSCEASSILLIDIESTSDHHHGYSDKGAGYSSLNSTKEFLRCNGVDPEIVKTCNPRLQRLPNFEFSLLLSILSMGFHYPCGEYVQFIKDNALDDARIVLDKRSAVNDSGFDSILSVFSEKEEISSSAKHSRFVLSRYRSGHVA